MHVLIADDEPVSRRLLQATLDKDGYDVVVASDGLEAWEIIQRDEVNLAVLDWVMPGIDGVEVCRRVRAREAPGYKYMILVTSKEAKDDIVEALSAGADDYVTKPFYPAELNARVRTGARIVRLEAAIHEAQEELRYQATRDELTGLWNRRAILQLLGGELERSRREERPVGIIMADIDHFKDVNDTHGHQAGDAVLKEVAARMLGAVREYDRVGRYGGEELLVLVPGCDEDLVHRTAERIRQSIADEPIEGTDGPIQVTLSSGATSNEGRFKANSTALIRASDRALYAAKHGGRNRVVVATDEHWA